MRYPSGLAGAISLVRTSLICGGVRRPCRRTSDRKTHQKWTGSNPHTYFYVDVKDDKGKVVNWGCEAGAPGALSRRGMKKNDLKIGDTHRLSMAIAPKTARTWSTPRRVTLADGRTIFGGSAGDRGTW